MNEDLPSRSLQELFEIQGAIDPRVNPERSALATKLINQKLTEHQNNPTENANETGFFSTTYVRRNFVWPVRLLSLVLAIFFALVTAHYLQQEQVTRRLRVYEKGEFSHFLYGAKHLIFVVLFLWVGTFGTKVNTNRDHRQSKANSEFLNDSEPH